METIEALDEALTAGLITATQHAAAQRPPRAKFVNFGEVTATALLSHRPLLTVANHDGNPVVSLHASGAGFTLVASLRPAEAVALADALTRAAVYAAVIELEGSAS